MLTHPTFAILTELGLHGMARGFQDLRDQPEARALEHGDRLALLLEREATARSQKRFEARARAARLRHDAVVVLDRLVHNAYRIELTGESLRKKARRPAFDPAAA